MYAYEIVPKWRSFNQNRFGVLLHIGENLMNKEKVVVYIHGKGGNAQEAEHFRGVFGCDVVGLDYLSTTPWQAKEEFPKLWDKATFGYKTVEVVANSIGAYFAMNALSGKQISQAYFISPIVDMEKLICDMMQWSNVTEDELRAQKEIATTFGETLSWQYLCYVRENPVVWQIPTHILFGEHDNLTSQKTMSDFADKIHATLTVMSGGEHWFHTESQMEFLDDWLKRHAQ